MRLIWTLLTLLIVGSAPPGLAQAPENVADAWIFLGEGRERWLHERQDPRFTAYARIDRMIRATPVAAGADGRGHREILVSAPLERRGARVTMDSLGRVAEITAAPGPAPVSTASHEGRFVGGIGALRLPHSIAWEVIPLLGRTEIRSGDEWTDTLDLVTEHDGARQTLHGPRVRSVRGDTLIDGRRHWIDRDQLFESIRRALLAAPPAVMVDSSFRACTVGACRMLAALADSASEPRLRDLGLIARLVLEPARWDAAVLERVAEDAPFLEPAAALIRGDRPSGEPSPLHLPPADAAANDWLAWLSWRPLLSRNDASILRFAQARGERDLVGELRRLRTGPAHTPPQLAVEALLVGLGAEQLDADVVAARLRSADTALREHAMRQMQDLLRAAPRAPPEVTQELIDRLLEIVRHGADAWPPFEPSSARRPQNSTLPMGGEKVYLVADDLPPAVRERWAGELELVAVQRLAVPPDGTLLPGCHMRVQGPVQVGPFARVSAFCTLIIIREGGEPAGYAASVMYDLMREGGEWVTVPALRGAT